MPQIIEEYRKPGTRELFGQAFANAGNAAAKAIPEYMQQRNDTEYMKKNYGNDLSGLSQPLREAEMVRSIEKGIRLKQAKATVSAYDNNNTQSENPSNYQEPDTNYQESPSNKQKQSNGVYSQPETDKQTQRIRTPKEGYGGLQTAGS